MLPSLSSRYSFSEVTCSIRESSLEEDVIEVVLNKVEECWKDANQLKMCIHTWVWSTIFHTRDNIFTERMDYFCAFASVLCGLYISVMRLARPHASLGVCAAVAMPFVLYFTKHVTRLMDHFDYGYNMRVNIFCGAVNSIVWYKIVWDEYRKGRRHVGYCMLVVLLANVTLALEVLDFPPIWWTFDAHSLWHLSTVPLPWIWARFIEKDCRLLHIEKDSPKLHFP